MQKLPQIDWANINEESLLDQKISKLGLSISEKSEFYPYIQQLYQELNAKGLAFNPPCFLADEWFCPVDIPAIGIPFYLAHPKLKKLEKKNILEVEGGTHRWFMRLIRHEAGHAFSYAYKLFRRKTWKKLFGSATEEYQDTYKPRPHSRSYVVHLDNWYAQSHPDEDFAETFAVWLTPGSLWKKDYANWKALDKLNYVDQLMRDIKGKPPIHQPKYKISEISGLNIKLKTFYKRKKNQYEESYPDYYDSDLTRLFVYNSDSKSGEKASRYLRRHRKAIRDAVARWTREKKYTINAFLKDLITRCDQLDLRVNNEIEDLDTNIGSYVSSMIMTHLFTGKFKRF